MSAQGSLSPTSTDLSVCIEQLGIRSLFETSEEPATPTTVYLPPLSTITEAVREDYEEDDFSDVKSTAATVGVDEDDGEDGERGRHVSRGPRSRVCSPPPPGHVRIGNETIDGILFVQIRNHSFEPKHLYKLANDTARRPRTERHAPPSDASVYSSDEVPMEEAYPDLFSIVDPLSKYFKVLNGQCRDLETLRDLAECLAAYVTNLVWLQREYEWQAVLEYHLAFHRKRLPEMRGGIYCKWLTIDEVLKHKLLDCCKERQTPRRL
ncbi:hypothetical protein BD311DRAFT_218931 [Dichomitus squalens]|uniref:Uncharacterized protein n=1 Tax=Dichomitus squalens TaxID=114155 RepID=A0A4Q9MTB8_9APHY|nr:hypothetical protein BD311DRAFT_218931 [Dichomitus squalens]